MLDADKVCVAHSEFGKIPGQFEHFFSCGGMGLHGQQQHEVGHERVLGRRVELPPQCRQDPELHLFNVLGPKLSSTQTGQSGELDLFGFVVVQFARNVKRCEGGQEGQIARALVPARGHEAIEQVKADRHHLPGQVKAARRG